MAFERLMGKHCIHCHLGMAVEAVHLLCAVAFSKDGHIYGFLRVIAFMNISVRNTSIMSLQGYENVVGRNSMSHRCHDVMTHIENLN